jgi:hypothetical protein
MRIPVLVIIVLVLCGCNRPPESTDTVAPLPDVVSPTEPLNIRSPKVTTSVPVATNTIKPKVTVLATAKSMMQQTSAARILSTLRAPTKTPQPTATKVPVITTNEIIQGYSTGGFEVSSFVPCTDGRLPGYGIGYWITYDQDSGFEALEKLWNDYARKFRPTKDPRDGGFVVYIKAEAKVTRLAKPGEGESPEVFGHDGLYEGEIVVIKLLDSAAKRSQCGN